MTMVSGSLPRALRGSKVRRRRSIPLSLREPVERPLSAARNNLKENPNGRLQAAYLVCVAVHLALLGGNYRHPAAWAFQGALTRKYRKSGNDLLIASTGSGSPVRPRAGAIGPPRRQAISTPKRWDKGGPKLLQKLWTGPATAPYNRVFLTSQGLLQSSGFSIGHTLSSSRD